MHGLRTNIKSLRFAQAIFTLRFRQWIHFALLPLASFDASDANHFASPLPAVPRAIAAVLAASGALSYAYGINAIADRRSDDMNGKNPLAGMSTLPIEIYAMVVLAALFALALGLWLGRISFFLALLSVAAGTVYSAGPRMKSKPFLGLIFNTLIFVPLLGLGLSDSKYPLGFTAISITFTALLIQNQLLHECADTPEDARAQNLTTARFLGERNTRGLAFISALAGILLSYAFSPGAALFWACCLSLGAGTWISVMIRNPRTARSLHKMIALITGSILFALSIFL